MNSIRLVIADDHTTFVRAIELLFERDPEIEVVGTANTGVEAVRKAIELQPDVMLMDVNMPGMNGIEATAAIGRDAPYVAVVMLTMFDDDTNVLEALRAAPAATCSRVRVATKYEGRSMRPTRARP